MFQNTGSMRATGRARIELSFGGPWWRGEEAVAWPRPRPSETLPPVWPFPLGTLTDLLPLTQHLPHKVSGSFKYLRLKSCFHFDSKSAFQRGGSYYFTRSYSRTRRPQPRGQALGSCSFCALVAEQGAWPPGDSRWVSVKSVREHTSGRG